MVTDQLVLDPLNQNLRAQTEVEVEKVKKNLDWRNPKYLLRKSGRHLEWECRILILHN
jgi:hypothetical protein